MGGRIEWVLTPLEQAVVRYLVGGVSEPSVPKSQAADKEEIPWDFEGTRRHHLRLGLQMTPAERLRWLEETVEEMRRLQGLARRGRRIGA